MTRILAALALTVGGFGVAACHTTSAQTLCAEHTAYRNDLAGYNKYSLVDADKVSSNVARCLLRNNQTFQTDVDCVAFDDHGYAACP